jgi:hypothetical protein
VTSSSLLPPVLTIGDWSAKFVWLTRAADEAGTERVGALPAAVLIEHPPSFGAPAHTMLVPWVPVEGSPGEPFTLESLAPLTVVQPVTCSICGVSGRIESGAWLPTEGGGRG